MKENYSNNNFISVIIPVYNNSDKLVACLDALSKQTLEKSKFEIIVIDNCSTDNIKSLKEKYPAIKFFNEAKEGSYAARNKGILNSKGQVLAFTDSDCLPAKDWLEKGLLSIENKLNAGFVAGKVNLFIKDKNKMTCAEIWEMLNMYDQKSFVKNMNFGTTANLFTKKSVIEKIGIFDYDLKSCGDYEWGNRVYRESFNIYYDENIIVSHPARKKQSQICNTQRRITGGQLKIGILTRRDSIIKILIDIFPPVLSTYKLIISKEFRSLNRFTYKIKYILVYYCMRSVTLYELIRLMLGGKPIR